MANLHSKPNAAVTGVGAAGEALLPTWRTGDCGYAGGGGDALLSFEDAAQRRPTGILTAVTQPCADHLQELIGDHGDEQMAVGADGLVVIDRA